MRNNEKGNIMVFTVIAFSVLFVFTMAVMTIGDSSSKHAVKEESKTKAHYVAKTGAQSVIKHLEDTADINGSMRDELVELIARTDAGDTGEGKYKDGDFKIEVKKEVRKNKDGIDKTVYLVRSKGEIGKGKDIGKDQMTAVLTPEYEVQKSWGSGTVDAAGKIYFADPAQLGGTGLILSTDAKKKRNEESPIFFGSINDLFIAEPARVATMGGYELIDRDMNAIEVYSEKLISNTNPAMEPIGLVYGKVRKKPDLTFPAKKGTDVVKNNVTIDVNNPTVGTVINEKYEVVEFDKSGEVQKAVRQKEYLKIEAPVFELSGAKNIIKTSTKRDIVIYTDILNIMGLSTIDVQGNGNVYIFVTGQANVYGGATIGANLTETDPTKINASTNIHIYLNPNIQMTGEDNATLKNIFVYGPKARIELDGGAKYKGMMLTDSVSFNGECAIQSPVDGTPNEDTDPIIGFESIEWER